MKKLLFAFIPAVLSFDLVGCAASFAPVPQSQQKADIYYRNQYNPKQNMVFNLPQYTSWAMATPSAREIVYIPSDQNFSNWKQLISNRYTSFNESANAKIYADTHLKSFFQQACESVQISYKVSSVNQVLYQGTGTNCDNIAGEELLYGKIITGKDGIYLLQYQYYQAANRNDLYTAVVNAINNSRLEDANRQILQ